MTVFALSMVISLPVTAIETGSWGWMGNADPHVALATEDGSVIRPNLPMSFKEAISFLKSGPDTTSWNDQEVLLFVHRRGQEKYAREMALNFSGKVATQCYDDDPTIWRAIYKVSLPCYVSIVKNNGRTYFNLDKRPPINGYAKPAIVRAWWNGEKIDQRYFLPVFKSDKPIIRERRVVVQRPPVVQQYVPLRMNTQSRVGSYGYAPRSSFSGGFYTGSATNCGPMG